MTFETNWNFSEKYIPQVRDILKENAMFIVNIEVASPEDDMKHSTDLKVKITAGDVAVRIRRGKYNYRDITIRAFKNGYKTEIHKLREGFGDWYLYAWENKEQTEIVDWALIDINKARSLFTDDRQYKKTDETSGFYTYTFDEFIECDALVNCSSYFWND